MDLAAELRCMGEIPGELDKLYHHLTMVRGWSLSLFPDIAVAWNPPAWRMATTLTKQTLCKQSVLSLLLGLVSEDM